MTINELLEKTMVKDPANPNFVSFDSNKLNEEQQNDECSDICIHCVLDEQAERIENLEAELWDTQTKLNSLIKLLNMSNVRALK